MKTKFRRTPVACNATSNRWTNVARLPGCWQAAWFFLMIWRAVVAPSADININSLTIEQNGATTSVIWKDKPATFTAQTDCTDPGPIYSCKWADDLSDQTASWADGKAVANKTFPQVSNQKDDKNATFEVYKNAALIASQTEKFSVAEIKIKQDGNDITETTHSEIVGKRISLLAEVKPDGLSLTDKQWTIPQKRIGNYTRNSNQGKVFPVGNLNSSSVVFYWVDDADGRKVQWSGKADSNPGSAKATFDVKRPTAQIDAYTGANVTIDNAYFHPGTWLHWGTAPAYGTPGIQFSISSLSIPAGFTGETEWIQTANILDMKATFTDLTKTRIGSGLDGMHATAYADAPGDRLFPNDAFIDVNDGFATFLMFKPTGTGNIWVPLRVIPWSYHGVGTKQYLFSPWTLQLGWHSVNPGDADTTTHPTWQQNIGSIPWIISP